MSGNCVSVLIEPRLKPFENVRPESVERENLTLLPPLPVYCDHAKYTSPSQGEDERSTSMAVLSLNLPPVPGADEPLATITERLNSLPSSAGSPSVPSGFAYVATQTSPKPLTVPAG